MEQLQGATLNVWQAKKNLTIKYLRPERVVKENEFLFLIDIKNYNIYVFKTEDGAVIMLPDKCVVDGSVERVF